jgi:hypothetical protein
MPGYRVYFIDLQGHIKSREEFFIDDDERAIEHAREIFSSRIDRTPGFEVWREKHRVHSEWRTAERSA